MSKTKGLRCLVAFAGACCALGASSAASAYNRPTHQRIVEAAVEAMVDAPNSPRPGQVTYACNESGTITASPAGACVGPVQACAACSPSAGFSCWGVL